MATSRFLALSEKLLNKNGVTCTINNYSSDQTTFDPILNEYVRTLEETYKSKLVFTSFEAGDFKNDINFEITDKMILLLPIVDKKFNIDSELIYDTKKYLIKRVDEIKEKEVTVLFKAIIKEV